MKVELKEAFWWFCDNCAAENYARAKQAELNDSDAEEAYRRFHMLEEWAELPEDWRSFKMLEQPKFVECPVCGERFETESEAA